ncbi:MAG: DUF2726 domain-containing protein [bacterium]|nr:DUF2726 domain-containing protein [bacterium]
MTELLVLVVIVVVAVVLLVAAKAKSGAGSEEGPWPFYAKKPLSVPEQILYSRLSKSLPEHIVLAQVGLSRLLGVKKGNNSQAWQNRINRMSSDFVVCSRDSSIVAVIELDDASHEREDRKVADAKKEKALGAAGIRIIRWQAKSLPDEAAIKATFHAQQRAPADTPVSASLRQGRG